jgi:autotransporter translocation and assembly factor TamB
MGPIALNDSGSSNLVAHIEAPSLDRLGRLVGQDNLKGGAAIDATVTGNGQQLKASGMIDGSNLGYGGNTALDTNSMFDVTLPNLSATDATVHAKTTATFLQVAGQQVNQVTADTTYAKQQLNFDATAKQGVRQLTAQGSALLHTDHDEVHIGSLALQTEVPPPPKGSPQPPEPKPIVWRTEPSSHPTIQYGNDRVVVDDIALVNGDQRIEASGAIGTAADTIHVKANNVDVAQIDALALGDQRLAGRLNANAAISGTTSAPRVAGDFSLLQGAFRNFKFMSFGGKVDYAGNGVNVDVRLDQDAQSWLTAKGFAPLSLFSPTPAAEAGRHIAARPGDEINLEVASSQIDLGAIQGFTSYLTNVTGTMQANVNITGSGEDPHLNGAIDVNNGAFTVPDLGMTYAALQAHVDLKPDAVTLTNFTVTDQDKHTMTAGGTLGVHEGAVGNVDVEVKSTDFHVINDKTGDVKLDTDVHLTGSVRQPKLKGTVNIEPGFINVAEVIAQATNSPYSTTATEIEPANSGNAVATPQVPSPFDALDLQLKIAIPNNLLLKGQGIKPANAPIDIGDMNAYVAGAVNVVKEPGGMVDLRGDITTVRGTYAFQGRRFDILRDGTIRFQGGREINPILDLQAQRTISGVQATVHVRGTMLRPELSFSSNPPLDESDILSLIIFNVPTNELGEGQQTSLATRAEELAGGYLASGLSQSIGKALNLDEFEIQAAGDQGTGPTVTLGQQIGKGFFVHLQQGMSAEQATEFILEYQINSFLRLRGAASDASSTTQRNSFQRVERGGLDLIFFFNY